MTELLHLIASLAVGCTLVGSIAVIMAARTERRETEQ